MTWQPGEPIYTFTGCFPRRLVELIQPSEGWADAASWPDPIPGQDLERMLTATGTTP